MANLRVPFLIAALLAAASASANMTYSKGLLSVVLLDSGCSSEVAIQALKDKGAKTAPKRADVMIAGQFTAACWSKDEDGDFIIMDRKGTGGSMYRREFHSVPQT